MVRELQDILDKRREVNHRYSLRAFARDLKMDPSVLSKILRGDRGISRINLLKLCKGLGFSEEQINDYLKTQIHQQTDEAEKRLIKRVASGATIQEFRIHKNSMSQFLDNLDRIRAVLPAECTESDPRGEDFCVVSLVYLEDKEPQN
ncbi:helix-turn-helix domain-containing protein [Bdellovibrio sp.]|uniref:helix-turn-helix domain-containing protein n=1 Tax=Bdellovibrio sp. TaxID=28201 RepID=UPI0039E627CE